MQMWEWWRRVEKEYREKRRREDEQRERERRERARRSTAWERIEEARRRPEPTMEEILEHMEREWGVNVEWETWGVERPKARGVQVEVIEGNRRDCQDRQDRRDQEDAGEGLLKKALVMVLTGRWRN